MIELATFTGCTSLEGTRLLIKTEQFKSVSYFCTGFLITSLEVKLEKKIAAMKA